MNCPNCNAIVDTNDTICISCGASLNYINNPNNNNYNDNNLSGTNNESVASVPSARSIPKNNGMALASMVLGIVSVPLMPCCVGAITGIIAIVLGFIAKKKIAESNGLETGYGMTLAGIIIGFAVIGITIIAVIIFIILMIVSPEAFDESQRGFYEGVSQ